ncbi:MAG: InlB B-repeat-containing protein [Coriobacteriales bacterium]|nr:InlB B-repeat-containing protein [Coriobacteriales bacterium]
MRKRIIVLCMLIATLCLSAMPAPALADGTVASADKTWDGGTWSVTSDVELTNRVAVQGEVTLELGAGTTLTAPQGITVNDGNTLTITGEGTLKATGLASQDNCGLAGIGSGPDAAAGTIIIQGGTVIAHGGQSSEGTSGAAGIGGSTAQSTANPSGIIRIEGGTVEAYGGGGDQGGAGIGGENGCGADVTITGGTVHATGGKCAAAIGAGNDAGRNLHPDVNIAIDGGTVDVGAGTIGGDWNAGNVTVTITGGQVTGIIGANSFASVENVTYAATVALAWSSVDDFVDARYPNATVTFNKGFRKANDADKALVSPDEAMGFSDQTKIVPRMVVSFEPNGGTPAPPDYVADDGGKVAKPDDPAKDGCRFDGWYLDQDLTQPFLFDSDTVDKDCTLYAKWTTLHTVTFNSNGGTAVESQVVVHGESATRPGDPTREGCTFEGWYEDEAFSTVYDFAKAVEADLTLYAKWLPPTRPSPP